MFFLINPNNPKISLQPLTILPCVSLTPMKIYLIRKVSGYPKHSLESLIYPLSQNKAFHT